MSKRKTPISKSLPKHFADEAYHQACSEPFLWLVKAREMRRAADLVWEQFSAELAAFAAGSDNGQPFTGGVAMMLYGLALENLLKAGLVHKGLGTLPNGNFNLKSHALEDLADELDIVLLADERELLERLEQFIEWAGRYPLPLYAQALYPRAMVDGSEAAMHGLSSLDRSRVAALIERVRSELPSEDEALKNWAARRGLTSA